MAKSCTLKTAREIAYGVSDRVKVDSEGVMVGFNYKLPPNRQFAEANKVATQVMKAVNEAFLTEEFGKVATKNTTYTDSVGVNIKIPPKLEKAYEIIDGVATLKDLKSVEDKYIPDDSSNLTAVDEEFFSLEAQAEQVSAVQRGFFLEENEVADEYLNNNLALEEQERAELFRTGFYNVDVRPKNIDYNAIQNNPEHEANVSFDEYLETRVMLLKDVEDEIQDLYKIKNKTVDDKMNLKNLAEFQKSLESDIRDLHTNQSSVTYKNINNEIDSLSALLDALIEEDPISSIVKMKANKFEERFQILQFAFNKYKNAPAERTQTNEFLRLGLIDGDVKVDLIENKVDELIRKYNDNLGNYVYNLAVGSENITAKKELMYEEATTPEEIKAVDEKIAAFEERARSLIEEDATEGSNVFDKVGHSFLPAGMYDSIFTDLFELQRDINERIEKQRTSISLNKFNNRYDAMSKAVVGDTGQTVTELMFKKDEFGVARHKLLTPFSDKWYSDFRSLKGSLRNFQRTLYLNEDVDRAWNDYIDTLEESGHVVQPHLMPEVFEAYSNDSEFKDFFDTDSSKREAAKNDYIENYGETAYKKAVESVLLSLENFKNDKEVSPSRRLMINPLAVAEHLNSPNKRQPNEDSGFYYNPKYNYVMPKKGDESYINQDFKQIEDQNFKEFSEFYNSLEDLLRYTNDKIDSSVQGDIVALYDTAAKELFNTLNDYSVLGKPIPKWLIDVVNAIARVFSSHRDIYAAKKFEKKGVTKLKTSTRKIREHWPSVGKNEGAVMVESYFFEGEDFLRDKAKKYGLTIPDSFDFSKNGRKLANAIVQTEINRSLSFDLKNSINTGVKLAQSYQSRKNTRNVLNYIKAFLNTKEDTEQVNTKTFLDNMEQQVIIEQGFSTDYIFGHFERIQFIGGIGLKKGFKIKAAKSYTQVERDFKRFLKNERKNLFQKDMTFVYNGDRYEYKNGSAKRISTLPNTGTKVTTKISDDVLASVYESYFDAKLAEIGTPFTLGTIFQGIFSNFYSVALAINAYAGFGNRFAGKSQNNAAAASGEHGFDEHDLRIARQFLANANIIKTIGYGLNVDKEGNQEILAKLGIKTAHDIQQLQIFKMLADRLDLINQQYEETVGETDLFRALNKKFGDFLTDPAVNNPEFKNQGEILVAMMINTKIDKIMPDGSIKKVSLFDPVTRTFPMDADGVLKPEYRTESNIQNWESTGGKYSNNLILNFKQLRDKLHGPYNKSSRLVAEKYFVSKLFTVFKKWFFGNMFNEYGTKQIDLINMEINQEGRKIPILRHKGALAAHIAGSALAGGWGRNIAIGVALASGFPVIAGVLGGASIVAGTGLYLFYKKEMKRYEREGIEANENFKEEYKIGLNYFTEILKRYSRNMLKLMPVVGGKMANANVLDPVKHRDKISHLSTISEKDRKIISESAQMLSDQAMYGTIGLVASAIISTVGAAILGVDDDDDEDELEEGADLLKKHNRKKLEGYVNFNLDFWNTQVQNLSTYQNPLLMLDILGSAASIEWLWKTTDRKFIKPTGKYLEDASQLGSEYDGYNEEALDNLLVNYREGLLDLTGAPSFPRKILKGDYFERSRTYAPKWYGNDAVLDGLKTEEVSYKKKFGNIKEATKAPIEKHYIDVIQKKLKKGGYETIPLKVATKLARERVNKFFRENDIKVDEEALRDEKYFVEEYDWKQLLKDGLQDDIEIPDGLLIKKDGSD